MEYWAPYQPKIGDRVRLRLSPECPKYQEAIKAGFDLPNINGSIATVLDINSEMPNGHHYFIEHEIQETPSRKTILYAWIAAYETIPIKDED